ncbi:MAG: GTPase Era [Candidatus Gracilibacteria bacterium]|nr:GTPase Era [Candidatus Gracilibacteria bacterium]MDD3119862.1 GTPase Era [Candidatus Gracilibacteria bacterium]MDD4530019.1 GTPase Era [Candidatus Gracilibacteria bacterium]
MQKKVGFVALIGRPNSGKSTFINYLIGEKVSIISPKPQTTRKVIKGIYNDHDSQIVFFDTPGVNEIGKDFNIALNEKAYESIKDADLVVRFIDSTRGYGNEEQIIEDFLSKIDKKVIETYAKCDVSGKKDKKRFSISGVTGEGLKELIEEVKKYLPEGNPFYDEDYYTDQDIYTRVTEIIREKIFLYFEDEIPHSTFVEIEDLEELPNILKFNVTIFTETDSQKYVIIGKGGSNLTKIGTEARKELQEIFGKKIFIGLKVKTMPKWRKNKKVVGQMLK